MRLSFLGLFQVFNKGHTLKREVCCPRMQVDFFLPWIIPVVLLIHVPSGRADDAFSIDWFTVNGGAGSMTGGTFALDATIGQSDAGISTLVNARQFLRGGFWSLDYIAPEGSVPKLVIDLGGPTGLILSWYPDVPGFVLQKSMTLLPDSWMTLSPGPPNPATLSAMPPRQFFRLLKP